MNKAPKPELSKAEQKRLRQEKDPTFKTPKQKKPTNAPPNSQGNAPPEQPPRTALDPPKRKARGIGFDEKSDQSKKQRLEHPDGET